MPLPRRAVLQPKKKKAAAAAGKKKAAGGKKKKKEEEEEAEEEAGEGEEELPGECPAVAVSSQLGALLGSAQPRGGHGMPALGQPCASVRRLGEPPAASWLPALLAGPEQRTPAERSGCLATLCRAELRCSLLCVPCCSELSCDPALHCALYCTVLLPSTEEEPELEPEAVEEEEEEEAEPEPAPKPKVHRSSCLPRPGGGMCNGAGGRKCRIL